MDLKTPAGSHREQKSGPTPKHSMRILAAFLVLVLLVLPVRAATSADSLLWKEEAPKLKPYALVVIGTLLSSMVFWGSVLLSWLIYIMAQSQEW